MARKEFDMSMSHCCLTQQPEVQALVKMFLHLLDEERYLKIEKKGQILKQKYLDFFSFLKNLILWPKISF